MSTAAPSRRLIHEVLQERLETAKKCKGEDEAARPNNVSYWQARIEVYCSLLSVINADTSLTQGQEEFLLIGVEIAANALSWERFPTILRLVLFAHSCHQ